MLPQRILYVASEIAPFLETSLVASCVRKLSKAMYSKQMDVRILVPKFGVINDRMNRLHEVLRLSGSVVLIHDTTHVISVKVSTIPTTRLQVYFIDNSDLFGSRRAVFNDQHNLFYADNELRMIFFCTGVMETLKKLGWEADIVHCHGWITSLVPLFWKKLYRDHPIFAKAKLISTIYNETFSLCFPTLSKKLAEVGVAKEDAAGLASGSFRAIIETAIGYSDLSLRGEVVDAVEFGDWLDGHKFSFVENDEDYHEGHLSIYKKLLSAT